ncbi:hypothetical protein [Methylobacillus flagellatus]|nr:hypothetical protein [Methylobacillus flagellatus]
MWSVSASRQNVERSNRTLEPLEWNELLLNNSFKPTLLRGAV